MKTDDTPRRFRLRNIPADATRSRSTMGVYFPRTGLSVYDWGQTEASKPSDEAVEWLDPDLTKADEAVKYVLDRAQTDADLGYLIGPGTQTFEMLCAAEAARTGEPIEAVKAKRSTSCARYPRRYLSETEHEAQLESRRLTGG